MASTHRAGHRSWVARPAFVAVLAAASCLCGCLPDTATVYQPEGLSGGYEDERIDGASWQVRFSGNSYLELETAETYWLYRCAEVALARGYDGFSIIEKSEGRYEQGKPKIEGTIALLKQPLSVKAGQRFDARQVVASLRPFVTGPKCRLGNICLDGWRESVAYGLFMRLTIYNLTPHVVVATVGDETRSLNEKFGPPHLPRFATLQYPREAEAWRLSISSGNCTYAYDMPRDLTDVPWRAFTPGNADIPMQLAENMSLYVVPPHPWPRADEFVRLLGRDYRPPIIPKRDC